jgi:hypothetical protein
VAEKISKYKLDLVGVQDAAGEYIFFMENRMRIMNYVQGLSCIRESYQQL